MLDLRRHEFITLLGGAAAWPLAARAQQPEGMRRLAIIMLAADDADRQARIIRPGARGWRNSGGRLITGHGSVRTDKLCSSYTLTDQDDV
jgi:hypothetical protein